MSYPFLLTWLCLVLLESPMMRFKPPDVTECLRAIGPTSDLPETFRRALDPGDGFEPIPAPGPHDWLANHPEAGQTFGEFVMSKPNRPRRTRIRLIGSQRIRSRQSITVARPFCLFSIWIPWALEQKLESGGLDVMPLSIEAIGCFDGPERGGAWRTI